MVFLKIKGPAAWSLVRTQPGPPILNEEHETGSEAAVKPAQRNRSRVLLQVTRCHKTANRRKQKRKYPKHSVFGSFFIYNYSDRGWFSRGTRGTVLPFSQNERLSLAGSEQIPVFYCFPTNPTHCRLI